MLSDAGEAFGCLFNNLGEIPKKETMIMNDKRAPPSARVAEMREKGRRGGYRGRGKQVHPEKRQMREIARAHGPECIERLRWLSRHGESHLVQLAATNALLDRGFGKPGLAEGENAGIITQVRVITGVRENWPPMADPATSGRPLLPDGRDAFAPPAPPADVARIGRGPVAEPPCPVRLIEGAPRRDS